MWEALGARDARALRATTRCAASCCAARATRLSRQAPTSAEFATERANASQASAYGELIARRDAGGRALPAPDGRDDRRRVRRRRARDRGDVRPAHLRRRRAASACRSTASDSRWRTASCRACSRSSAARSRWRSCSKAASSTPPKRSHKRLVNRVVPDDDVEREAYATARAHCRGRAARRALAQAVHRAPDACAPQLTPEEWNEGFACFDTEDYRMALPPSSRNASRRSKAVEET